MRTILSVLVLIIFILVSCSKEEEPIELKWKEKLVRSWELSSYQMVSNNYWYSSYDKDIEEKPFFHLVFNQDDTYELSYSLPILPENRVPPLNLLEGSDHGTYSLYVVPTDGWHFEYLSGIGFNSETGKTFRQRDRPDLRPYFWEQSGNYTLQLRLRSFAELDDIQMNLSLISY